MAKNKEIEVKNMQLTLIKTNIIEFIAYYGHHFVKLLLFNALCILFSSPFMLLMALMFCPIFGTAHAHWPINTKQDLQKVVCSAPVQKAFHHL